MQEPWDQVPDVDHAGIVRQAEMGIRIMPGLYGSEPPVLIDIPSRKHYEGDMDMFSMRKLSQSMQCWGNVKYPIAVLFCMALSMIGAQAASAPTTTLSNPGGTNFDDFGAAVALSNDGNTLLVGAPETIATTVSGGAAQVGRAYLFARKGDNFDQQPILTVNDPEPLSLDEFGANLVLSGDASTLLVAASGGNSGAPRVYVFDAHNAAAPLAMLEDPDGGNDCFGQSLALSRNGSVALVGADCATVNGLGWAGKAYIYVRSNGNWSPTPVAVLTEAVPAQNDFFATGVALSADGKTAVIGSDDYSSTDPVGRAYVFTGNGSAWHTTPDAVLTDPGATPGSMFGATVALSGDGNTALVGAGNGSNGKQAYIFQRTGSNWSSTAAFDEPTAQTGSGFVNTVKLSADGRTAVVGLLTGTGIAQVFQRAADGNWSHPTTQLLNDPADANGDAYGWSAAISADGNVRIIGSPYAVSHANPAGSLFSSMPGPGMTYSYSVQKQTATNNNSISSTSNPQATQTATAASGGGAEGLFGLLILSMLLTLKTAPRRFRNHNQMHGM